MVNIAGVWNLVSFNYYINGTVVLQPNGPSPLGKISIMPEGYLSVQITTPGAQPIADGVRWILASDAAIGPIARPYISYCGRWTTETAGDQLQLVTVLDVSLDPSWMLSPQRRNVSFVEEGGKRYLELTPAGLGATLPNIPGDVIPVLRWEKEISF